MTASRQADDPPYAPVVSGSRAGSCYAFRVGNAFDMGRWLPVVAAATLLACGAGSRAGTDAGVPSPDPCVEAGSRLGYVPCASAVPDEAVYEAFAAPDHDWPETVRSLKYLVPTVAAAPLPTLFQDTTRFSLPYDFLVAAFPALYGRMTHVEYLDLVFTDGTRQYFAGAVLEVHRTEGTAYAFDVYGTAMPPTLLQVRSVYDALAPAFAPRPLLYAPDTTAQAAAATSWESPGFEVYYGSWVGGGP